MKSVLVFTSVILLSGCASLNPALVPNFLLSPFPMICTITSSEAVRVAADKWIQGLPNGPEKYKAEALKPLAELSADAACVAFKAMEEQVDKKRELGLLN
jgi:hypothetical protein